jgi:hypothetical protein
MGGARLLPQWKGGAPSLGVRPLLVVGGAVLGVLGNLGVMLGGAPRCSGCFPACVLGWKSFTGRRGAGLLSGGLLCAGHWWSVVCLLGCEGRSPLYLSHHPVAGCHWGWLGSWPHRWRPWWRCAPCVGGHRGWVLSLPSLAISFRGRYFPLYYHDL